MFTNVSCKLMDRLERDAKGKPTGRIRGRPDHDVMLDPREMTPELEPYRFTPTYIDDRWAGQETIYLRFTTEAEARAKLAKHLRRDDAQA
ncbi:MAG: hypothetical protein M3N07_03470 [Pseudomonadota bacterium]|nr:hypothetical protein [Pseudomonadota bacterium]